LAKEKLYSLFSCWNSLSPLLRAAAASEDERGFLTTSARMGYTRASCFSEHCGSSSPGPHQSHSCEGIPVIQPPPGVGAFQFVVLANLRAAQLIRGCRPRVEGAHKAIVIAQIEVAEGKVMQTSLSTVPAVEEGSRTRSGKESVRWASRHEDYPQLESVAAYFR
jgi:DNA-directed RNA polymerase subunit K/omega